uniref:Ectonucleoside triphosphate diphosphohydrolase 8 n=1 Tax=Leptobrachium leishanense TaxID=445787 RepID=A0A8C5QYB1_9ANUR
MVSESKNNCILVLLVISVISIVIALVLSVVNNIDVTSPPGEKFGMVFDAGSSHTSLFIYKWPTDKENNTGVVSQAHVCDAKGPGISSYAADPPAAGRSLVACLEEAMSIIPPERQKEAPAYLGATAGMRLLSLENPDVSKRILEEVAKIIRSYPINFRGARIISGQEEGAYGWITINYLLESFMKYSFSGRWVHPAATNIYGALDLGGASTQISFIPKAPIQDEQEKSDFRLYGFPYSIYTHSFLCYGQNQALKQMLVRAAAGQDLAKPVSVPCYPKGYTMSVPLQSLYNSPCTAADSPGSAGSAQFSIVGTGESSKCRTLIKSIFNFSACSGKTSCSFNGVYQPPITGNFYAFSAFFYTFDFLNLTSGQSLSTVTNVISTYCARDWSEIQASYPNQKEDRLRDYCTNGNYILSLLLDAYRFNADNWNSISFMKQAADTDIGWTLGYMLNLTNMIPSESVVTMKAQSYNLWLSSIVFLALCVVLGLVMLYVYCR